MRITAILLLLFFTQSIISQECASIQIANASDLPQSLSSNSIHIIMDEIGDFKLESLPNNVIKINPNENLIFIIDNEYFHEHYFIAYAENGNTHKMEIGSKYKLCNNTSQILIKTSSNIIQSLNLIIE